MPKSTTVIEHCGEADCWIPKRHTHKTFAITLDENNGKVGMAWALATVNTKPKAQRSSDALRHTLVLPGFIDTIARRMTYGAEKFGDWNWAQDMEFAVIFDHIQTHLNNLRRGLSSSAADPKGVPETHPTVEANHDLDNIAALACNVMMLWWYSVTQPEKLKAYQERQR